MAKQQTSWLKFLFHKSFYKHLLLCTLSIILIVFGVLIYLKIFTNHDNTIQLADYTYVHIDDADSIFNQHSLRYVVIDSIYNLEKEPGVIIDQDPKPGIHVKENRRVYLTVIAKKKKQIAMPDLIDLTHRSAIAKLKAVGLAVGDLSYVPNLAKNAVLKQKINGKDVKVGKFLTVGTAVDLVLGNGLSDVMVELPILEGLTLADARMVLQLSSLNLGLIIYESSVVDSTKAVVYRQRPVVTEERLIKLGKPVDVFLRQAMDEVKE